MTNYASNNSTIPNVTRKRVRPYAIIERFHNVGIDAIGYGVFAYTKRRIQANSSPTYSTI